MRVNSKIIVNLSTGAIVERESYEYSGPVAECITGSGGKTKSKSKQQSTSESGTKYNEDFLNQASAFANRDSPSYTPEYVKGAYTSVAPGGFDKLENSLYGTQSSKLKQAYDTSVGQQREELAQMGGLNSPSQYLEGSARSSLDRNYIQSLQQAARDAALGRLGAEQTDAQNRTAFDVAEAGRQTGFNQDTAKTLLQLWMNKLSAAIESGRYSTGQSTGESSGSGLTGSGGFFGFGSSNTTNTSTR